MTRCVLGIDVGTSSTKGVLVDTGGRIMASATRAHDVSRPRVGHVEMDAGVWWEEFISLSLQLIADAAGQEPDVISVGVSGMGPCVLLADHLGTPVRPAILYGVDTRATEQVAAMTAELGADQILRVGGSALSSQAAGPKIVWVAETEPTLFARAHRFFMPASWLVHQLTGAYVLDHQSASQVSPLYDVEAECWCASWWSRFAPGIEPPRLAWAGDVAGNVNARASALTGIAEGTPVIVGTIDAWSEAVSAGAHNEGDLMLMYGTTLFLIATTRETLRSPSMWTTVGAFDGTRNLAGGLATSGALTAWVSAITGRTFEELSGAAAASGVGARGLLMLPYFAGERTPILDPDARGIVAGLTLDHKPGDLYRAALEATAFAVRHNIETMRAAGCEIRRIVAVGGGTQSELWMQIMSDVTGLVQELPEKTIGASYGAAFLAANAVAAESERPQIQQWNPIASGVRPNPAHGALYDQLFGLYRDLYANTTAVVHELAAHQRHEQRPPLTTEGLR